MMPLNDEWLPLLVQSRTAVAIHRSSFRIHRSKLFSILLYINLKLNNSLTINKEISL
jgi:hypothetical protein